MTTELYPQPAPSLSRLRRQLAPGPAAAFHAFSEAVFAEGALPARTKHIIAVAVAHVTQCPYCIKAHTRSALKDGISGEELVEAIWVAAEMRAGGAFAHSVIALADMADQRVLESNGHDHAPAGLSAVHGH
jgi:AhpD family alkylhydroperoxidase